MRRQLLSFTAIILVMSFLISGCGAGGNTNTGKGDNNNENKGKIEIGLNNWAETIAVSNMWKLILEEKGYDVNLTRSSKSPLWAGVADGDLDVALEVWLPYTDKPLFQKYKKNIELKEPWYKGTGLGLVVPEYVKKIDSIEQLNKNKQMFNGKIIGIEPGSSLMKLTEKALKKYNLEYDLVESSGAAMMAQVKDAYDDKEPILVTLWNPHWAFAEYDLKYLKDPKNIYGKGEKIHYMTRTGFEKDHPEVVSWLNQWEMSHQQLATLMAVIKKTGDPAEGATQWIENNRSLVDKWTK